MVGEPGCSIPLDIVIPPEPPWCRIWSQGLIRLLSLAPSSFCLSRTPPIPCHGLPWGQPQTGRRGSGGAAPASRDSPERASQLQSGISSRHAESSAPGQNKEARESPPLSGSQCLASREGRLSQSQDRRPGQPALSRAGVPVGSPSGLCRPTSSTARQDEAWNPPWFLPSQHPQLVKRPLNSPPARAGRHQLAPCADRTSPVQVYSEQGHARTPLPPRPRRATP